MVIDVGEDVLAVGDEDDGFGAPAHHHQDQAQEEVDQGGAQDEERALFQSGDGLGVEEAGPGLVENPQGRQDDEGAFKAGGEIFDLAVAVGVIGVGALGGDDDAAQGEAGGHHVDDGLQGIGEDGGGIGEIEGNEFHGHQARADEQGGGDGQQVISEVRVFGGVHGSSQGALNELFIFMITYHIVNQGKSPQMGARIWR